MKPFDQATAIVCDALATLRDHAGNLPRASRESLERLIQAKAAPSVATQTPTALGGLGETAENAPQPALAKASASSPVASPLPSPSPAITGSGSKAEQLEQLRQQLLSCEKCAHLFSSRSHVVFGVGNPEAELMFVGEAPGADEDLQGEPFVGKAGQLLTKIIEAMGFTRADVYIANVLKCRPDMPPGESGNRKPRPEEMATCLPFLIRQIEIIQPKCLVALGATAMEGLLGQPAVMREVRGRWHDFKGTPLMATYHPAYLLRNQSLSEKRKVWEDMLQVLEKLERPISSKQRGYFLPK